LAALTNPGCVKTLPEFIRGDIERALHFAADGRLTQQQLCRAVGGNWQRIVNEVRGMVAEGAVLAEHGRFATYYSLPQAEASRRQSPVAERASQ
jgi:hypothetical protein